MICSNFKLAPTLGRIVTKCRFNPIFYSAKTYKLRGFNQSIFCRRLLSSTKFLNNLKHLKEKKMIRFFSDEKSFCPDQMYNKQKTGGSLPALRMFPN